MQTVVASAVTVGVIAMLLLVGVTVFALARAGILRFLNRRYPFRGFGR